MKNKNAITRYRLIDMRLLLKQRELPTLKDLQTFISEKMGTAISISTLQKDIIAMRYDQNLGYLAPIEMVRDGYIYRYRYADENYSIDRMPIKEEDLQGLELALGILEQFKELPAIKIFEDAISKMAASVKINREKQNAHSVLLLDRPKRYGGIEYLHDIVDAIRDKKVIRILYKPYNKPEPQKHTVHPYFIKEYQNRMYLIGKVIHPSKADKFITFSLDRMQGVALLPTIFREENLDVENYFSNTIGITISDKKPEKVILRCTPSQGNYFKSQPIHHTQTIIKDNENEFIVSLHVVINFELIALLLSYGTRVTVLEPIHFAEKIKTEIAAMQANYK